MERADARTHPHPLPCREGSKFGLNWLALGLALLAATPALAQQQSLQAQVEARLAGAVPGTRFGLVVAREDGTEIVAVNPDGRFIPASNTKMFTTAAAFATLPGLDQPDTAGGASVRIDGKDIILEGHGDARLSSMDDCKADCLATLADAVAAKTRRVRDVIGDDRYFPDQRWSPGMSWNNIPTSSGTGISALTLDDNEMALTITPGEPGMPPDVSGVLAYSLVNEARTVPGDSVDLGYDREPNRDVLTLRGTIGVQAKPKVLRFGIDDPARYAAFRLAALLKARSVKVTGRVRSVHRLLASEEAGADAASTRIALPSPVPLAALTPPPLAEDIRIINKVSQNLHAELLIRRIGKLHGEGSIAEGGAAVEAMLTGAGVPRYAYDFSDGSGMSSYNRVAPRGTVTFLRWVAKQPWGAQWRETLPVGGVDGTLSRRFKGTPLEGRVFAKTGTLNASNAIAGYLTAASGKTLTFAFYANDIPQDAGASKLMDETLAMIAAAE